nr:retrovirus-related Pol polyprotein from transposon TNT 1-94 [Tanacetum cinerariifolium]
MWETNSYKAHEDYMMLYEALEKSMNRYHTDELLKDMAEARIKKKKRRDSPKTPPGSLPYQPPPPPPPAGPSRTLGSPRASGSSQVPPPPPPPPSTNQEVQNVRNQVVHNAVKNSGVQNVGSQNGLIVVLGIANKNPNGNEDWRASTSSTQTDNAPVYDLDESAELSKEKSTVSFLLEEKKKLKSDFKTREYELLDKQIQLEKKIKELNNILVKTDDTTPSVARKFLNEVKSTLVTLQRVVKHRMTLEIHNWLSSAHQELHKMVKDENFPIVNQVDARVKNFEIQFLKEAAKFVGDFKSLAKEADESLAKHKVLELEIKRLLRAVVSQDIMSFVQKTSIVDTLNLQTELEPKFVRDFKSLAKEADESLAKHKALELEVEHLLRAVVSQDIMSIVESTSVVDTSILQTELEQYKYDKISYDKAYNDMKQKIKRLPAQLGDLKGKSKDTLCISNTLDPLSQNLEKKSVELEFHDLNYAKENAYLKTTYKNLFEFIYVTRTQIKTIIDSLQDKLHDTIYENAKLRAYYLIRINPFKPSREEKSVPNKVRASVRTKPITVSQLHVITKKDVNSDSNDFSFTGVGNNAKTRSPQPRNNTKNDWVIQICLWCVDTGCSKHMTKNLKLFIKFAWKFLGTVCFRNDHVAVILDFGDLQWGNILITKVYFVEGLGHNLFSVGQFCDSDLEVALRRNTCFIRNLEGVDLLKRNRITNLYSINLHEMAFTSLICLMARATSTKSWLWHQRLSHLNFNTINDLVKNNLVIGLLKFKYHKEHLCLSCEQGKNKRASHLPKPVPNSKQRTPQQNEVVEQRNRTALCDPQNDREYIGKLGEKAMDFEQSSSKPRLQKRELDLLFEAIYDDYISGQRLASPRTVLVAQAPKVLQTLTASTTIADTAPTPTNSSTQAKIFPKTLQDVYELKTKQQHAQQQENQALL